MADTRGVKCLGQEWYQAAEGPLEQGDILLDFPVLMPAEQDSQVGLISSKQIVLVLTQTCDIPKPSQKTILLVRADDYGAACQADDGGHLKSSDVRKGLSRGETIAESLLPPSVDGQLNYTVVRFRQLYVLPKTYVVGKSESLVRFRLRSPYKESFAQAYARFMMRVGLPRPLHEFVTN